MNEVLWCQLETHFEVDAPRVETESQSSVTKNIKSKIDNITKKLNLVNYSQTFESQSVIKDVELKLADTTRVAEVISTQPTFLDKRKEEKSALRKLQARIKEKTVSLEKALDAYGVIDNLIRTGRDCEIHARIYDLENHDIIDEITFSSNEFSKSDQQKLVENAIFYWYVGVEKSLMGQERRVSEFRLRRVFNPQTI